MSSTKTATLTLRISPEMKQKLKSAADHEHRSIANMIEVLIRDYCEQNKICVTNKNDEDGN
ncbi:MAG: hypothetical protein CMF38_04910 [Legionellaceae bacterium]|nr:hypothetical protein [Legionellaceae bacterium]